MAEFGAEHNGDDRVSEEVTPAPPPKGIDEVLYSDIGVTTLLNRLKQSISSAKDFAAFLKKRGSIEEEHAKELKRLAKSTQDSLHRTESRQGSYALRLQDVMRMHERMADNGMQFALSLHQMHEDLNELSNNVERGRKNWKHEGLNAEKRATDAESLMERAKAKYDGLAEDYDRAKTGDIKGSRRIMKGPKSAAQHEEDLLRKVQAADSDYANKVQLAKSQREELITTARPRAIKALEELIRECDSALGLQLQKFATFNEKLTLGNGLILTPLPTEDGSERRSLRDVMGAVDNDADLHNHIISQRTKLPPRVKDIAYEQHSTLGSKQQTPIAAFQPSQTQQPAPTLTVHEPAPLPPQKQQPEMPPTSRSVSQAQEVPLPQPHPDQQPAPPYAESPVESPAYANFPSQQQMKGAGPVSNGPPDRGFPTQQASSMSNPASPSILHSPTTAANNLPPPVRPVFGVDLETLFQRDGTAVPMVVYQCMQAVDLFGLDVEGIYRLSGTASHVQQLKAMFDNDASRVDFRNPTAFFHDVNSVAGLLKQFLRDLPDPLITGERYGEFISAARLDDDVVRRDTLHAIINSLPDANYATMRALVLHLHRVQEHYANNRMSTSNLAICFAPSFMGSHTGPQIGDAGLQARVLDSILSNTYQIFDED